MKKNCSFQFATDYSWGQIKIHKDISLITLNEAKKMWQEYLPQFIKELQAEHKPEMVIWINMKDAFDYREKFVHIDSNTETDGKRIWETKREYVEV